MIEEVSAEDKLVAQLAAPIIAEFKGTKKFVCRNRSAWKRMSRPSRLARMDKGARFIYSLIARTTEV